MAKYRVVGVREETPGEAALDKWLNRQILASPDNLEKAARQFIGLVTGLVTVLFSVLALAANPRPAYLSLPLVRAFGAISVVLLLAGLLASLVVVLPRRMSILSDRPDVQTVAFNRLLRRKADALLVAALAFGLGLVFLGGGLILALLATP